MKSKKLKILLIICFAIIILFLNIHKVMANTKSVPIYQTYTVQPGDTLWSIAEDNRVHNDIREDIYNIEQLNHCTANIKVGQELLIPVNSNNK